MNWKIGDRAIVDWPSNHHHGEMVTITSELRPCNPHHTSTMREDEPIHRVDIKPTNGASYTAFPPQHLKPIPYDGNNASTWSECDFKPAIPVEVE